MRGLIALLILIPTVLSTDLIPINQRGLIEEIAKHYLEKLRQLLIDGNEDLGVPSFAPLRVDRIDLDLSTLQIPNVHGTINLANVTLKHVPDWNLEHLQLEIFTSPNISFLFSWRSLDLLVEAYHFDISILGHYAQGQGQLLVLVDGLQAGLECSGDGVFSEIEFTTGNASLALDSSQISMGTLLVDGQDFTAMVAELVPRLPEILRDYQTVISDFADLILPGLFNYIKRLLISP